MGRPIKKIWIGERGGFAPGAGVASITVTPGTASGYTQGDPVTIGAPDIIGGTQAEGFINSAAGGIDSITMTVVGDGYTAPPAVTAPTGTIGTTVLTAVLGTSGGPTIQATAFIDAADGGTAALPADIIAQKGNITYRVETAEGIGEVELVAAAAPLVGEMIITATDSAGGTYFVSKLYNNTLRFEAGGTGVQFAVGDKVGWAKDGVAVLDESVSISA